MRCIAALLLFVGASAHALTLAWTNNFLTISGANIPGGTIRVLYIEAFCRSGSTDRDWNETVIPHKTTILSSSADQKHLEFLTTAENIEAKHSVQADEDEVEFTWT